MWRSKSWLTALGLSATVLIGLTACSDPEQRTADNDSAAVSGSLAKVCKAAQKEGTLVSWNSEDPDTFKKIYAKFQKAYPGIEVKSVDRLPVDIVQRLSTEADAGRPPEADALSITQEVSGPLTDKHLLKTDIGWKSMGVPTKYVAAHGGMVREERAVYGITYNTDKVSAKDLPSTWNDLIKSKWAHKVTVDPRGDPLDELATVWGKDKTIAFTKRLKSVVRPVVIQGATAGLLTIGSGENEIATNGPAIETKEQRAKGAPVAIKYLDVVPAMDYFDAVPAGAPHPNAGACWAGWENSKAGRDARKEFYKGNVDLPKAAEGKQVAAIANDKDVKTVAATAKEMSRIWRGASS